MEEDMLGFTANAKCKVGAYTDDFHQISKHSTWRGSIRVVIFWKVSSNRRERDGTSHFLETFVREIVYQFLWRLSNVILYLSSYEL